MGENFQRNQVISIPSACFPSISYWKAGCEVPSLYLDIEQPFQKQTAQNRFLIIGPNKPLLLTIPVTKPNGHKTLVRDIGIDNSRNWHKELWTTLKTAYNNSPYFEHYYSDIQPFFSGKLNFLLDFNEGFLNWVCDHLQLPLNLTEESNLASNYIDNLKYIQMPRNTDLDENNSVESHLKFEESISLLHYLFEEGPLARQRIVK